MIGNICIAILQIAGTLFVLALGAIILYGFYRLIRLVDDN